MLSTVAEVVRDLLIFVGVLAVLLVALIVVVSKLPDTNPLKQLLTALCYRLTFFRNARRTLSHTPSQRTVTDRQSR